MKNPSVPQRLVRALAAGACALVILDALPAFAAAPPDPDSIAFGLVGITFGQAVQVSVANTRLGQPPDPDAIGRAIPVAATLEVVDVLTGRTSFAVQSLAICPCVRPGAGAVE